jgi:hypothetical protein
LKALYSIANAVACALIDLIDKGNMTYGARLARPLRVDDLGTDDILATPVLVTVMDWLIGLTKRMSV